jgi:serine/threonine protein kinase
MENYLLRIMENKNNISEENAFQRSFLRVVLLLALILHRIIIFALLVALLTLILLFGLQFVSQDGFGSAPAVVTLHRYSDPTLNSIAGWLGMKWPAQQPPSYLPLGLCFVIFFLWMTLDQILIAISNPAKRLIKQKIKRDQDATIISSPNPPAQHRETPPPVATTSTAETVPLANPKNRTPNIEDTVHRIGRYEILHTIGRGAMGVVYKAKDPQIGRIVAIKSISAAIPSDPEFMIYKQRFMQEAKAAGQMLHSGIVTVYDLTEDKDGHPAMVMEFVEGVTLDKIMDDERPSFKRCMYLLAQAVRALDYAHQRGVIHRDIKPANLLITRNDVLKIADFGVAKLAGSSLTLSGQLLGTPAFMSPEQFTGSSIDGRSDLFSIGAILYWMCTGELPFPGESITSIGVKVMQSEPVSALQLNPSLPPDIELVLARCLAKRPDKRYATASDLAADLDALASGQPLPSESKKEN